MYEKGKISSIQMALMMYPTVLATGFISLPTISAQLAGNDFWMTGLFASVFGIITVLTVTRLHQLYPGMSVVQYSECIMGKWIGKLLGVTYFLFFTRITGIVVREYAEFVTHFLLTTPILLIMISILLLSGIAICNGVEVLARSATIFTPIFVIPLFFLLFLLPDMEPGNLLPVLSHGIVPVLKGTAAPQAWLCELFLMTFFLPFLTDPGKSRKWGFLSLSAIVLSMTYVNLITLFVLGLDSGDKLYPILIAFRYIGLADFFENLEALLLVMWVAGNFIKIGIFLYASVHSFTQCLGISDHRPFVFPIAMFCLILGLWDFPNYSLVGSYLAAVVPFEVPLLLLLVPLILLAVSTLRRKHAATEGGPST
ncbi:GerAB/ArcD/ProY family transporter [Paenibacillus silviterrae]|uniref:GerAB/ArcD/ProY family transporter n=1 Tax=Paenibacillus silviterrae TaxID=3242194 RepID=UPI0025432D4A|nr:endospore germination permease [Paenibacillus chinjuensis]